MQNQTNRQTLSVSGNTTRRPQSDTSKTSKYKTKTPTGHEKLLKSALDDKKTIAVNCFHEGTVYGKLIDYDKFTLIIATSTDLKCIFKHGIESFYIKED